MLRGGEAIRDLSGSKSRPPDSRQFGNFGGEKIDEKPNAGNGCTLWNDKQAHGDRGKAIVPKKDFELTIV